MTSARDELAGLDPFDIFDTEAARLDRFFSSLDENGWNRPSRCDGWKVRDVLAHLAGEELYNHACLDDDIDGFFEMLDREGVRGGFDGFNEWCVRKRQSLPVEQVLDEWRARNGETRARMRALGRDAMLHTSAGPYPAGLQTFHYDSEYATHADDVRAPVTPDEAGDRTDWRVRVGMFVLEEQGRAVHAERACGRVRVRVDDLTADLYPEEFVEATIGRLPAGHPLDPRIRDALRCLA
ncbi:MAG: maleylpyruvate isomerase family mycothiol-dependent enzyme [Thermobispora bispora]|nr:maleylpyruvate isomerase family mycothiol-dependent enzyme [Thermobispora bispora]